MLRQGSRRSREHIDTRGRQNEVKCSLLSCYDRGLAEVRLMRTYIG